MGLGIYCTTRIRGITAHVMNFDKSVYKGTNDCPALTHKHVADVQLCAGFRHTESHCYGRPKPLQCVGINA